ncbi:MAG: SurA N-terminal domain-containing protein [Bacteroidales bacterium]|nr:SurA N-terminal domain-containing protein [Bacteroidales bacterium]
MATLEKIRSKAGLLVGVVGFALFAFILGDLLNSGTTFWRQSKEVVVEIDGEQIKIQDYQKRVDEMTEVYKMQSGMANLSEEIQTQLRESIYRSIVHEKVLEREAAKIGLTVTANEILDMIVGDEVSPMIQPLFTNPQTGVFDKKAASDFIKAVESNDPNISPGQRLYWSFLQRTLKYGRLEEKFNAFITKSLCANQLDAKTAYENNKATADFAYVMQPYSVIADSAVTVTDKELRRLYDLRKPYMKQQEERRADLLVVDILPSEEDFALINDEISKLKDEFLVTSEAGEIVNENSDVPYTDAFVSVNGLDPDAKNFATTALSMGDVMGPMLKNNTYRMMKLVDKKVGPDSLKIAVIPVASAQDPNAGKTADSLMAVIQKGESFNQVARDYSQSEQGGEMGWFTEVTASQGLGPDFKNKIFSTPVGQVVRMDINNTLCLFKVEDKSADVTKYKIADVVMNVVPSSKTYGNIYNKLNQFITQNRDLKTFADTAKAAGYNVLSDIVITGSDPTVYNIGSSRPVVRWVFNAKTGSLSEIFECDDKFVVAGLKSVTEKGFRPFDEVKDVLKRELIKEKKGEKIAADMTALGATSLSQYAEKLNRKVDSVQYVNFSTARISGIGMEPRLNAAAILLPIRELSAPIAGNSGVFVINVDKRTDNTTPFDAKAEVAKLESTLPYRMMYQVNQVLNDKADVEDYRIRFY